MSVQHFRKRLMLRAVLRQVSPMVIRLVSVSDHMQLAKFHDIFRAILGWDGDLGYIIRVHGEEFNSFRRKNRSKALHELKLHRQEKFFYVCETLHMWEWDMRVIDIQDAEEEEDDLRTCVGGRGALRGSNRLSIDVETAEGRRCDERPGHKGGRHPDVCRGLSG